MDPAGTTGIDHEEPDCESNLYFNATCSRHHPPTHPAIDPCSCMVQVIDVHGLVVEKYSCFTRSMKNYQNECSYLEDIEPVNVDGMTESNVYYRACPYNLRGKGAPSKGRRFLHWWETARARTTFGIQKRLNVLETIQEDEDEEDEDEEDEDEEDEDADEEEVLQLTPFEKGLSTDILLTLEAFGTKVFYVALVTALGGQRLYKQKHKENKKVFENHVIKCFDDLVNKKQVAWEVSKKRKKVWLVVDKDQQDHSKKANSTNQKNSDDDDFEDDEDQGQSQNEKKNEKKSTRNKKKKSRKKNNKRERKIARKTSSSAATTTTATTTAVQIDDGDKDKDGRSKKRSKTSSSTSSSSSNAKGLSTHFRQRNAAAFWCDRCNDIHESNAYHDDDDSDSDDPDDSHSNDPDGIEKTIRIKVERGLQANPNTYTFNK